MDATLFQKEYRQIALWAVKWANSYHQSDSKMPHREPRFVFCETEQLAKEYTANLEAAHRFLERDDHFYAYYLPVQLEAIKK